MNKETMCCPVCNARLRPIGGFWDCPNDHRTWAGTKELWQELIQSQQELKELKADLKSGYLSDGYHTFNELYYHRMCLFSIIVKQNKSLAWKSKLHSDGTMYHNYFIVGIKTPNGHATYHYHIDYWDMFDCVELPNAPVWDGHTPNDCVRRLLTLQATDNQKEEE